MSLVQRIKRIKPSSFLKLKNYPRLLKLIYARTIVKLYRKTYANKQTKHVTVLHEKFNRLPQSEKINVIKNLESFTKPDAGIKYSFIAASRCRNNPNHHLSRFLTSLIKNAKNVNCFEVIVCIDHDDALLFFNELRQRFQDQIRLKFVINHDASLGYAELNFLMAKCLPFISPSSEIISDCSDDCIVKVHHWDILYRKISQQYADGIFFINLTRDYSLSYRDKETYFHELWQFGPPALFTGVGRKVLDIMQQVANQYDGWCTLGNTFLCDSYFETLQYYLYLITHEKRAPVLPDMMDLQKDVAIAKHKEGGLFGSSPVSIRAFEDFLKPETQVVLQEMAQCMAKELHAAPVTEHIIFA